MKRKRKIRTQTSATSTTSNLFIDLVGVAFLFIASFTFLAIISFNSKDPSWFSSTDATAKNYAGLVGAYWSSIVLHAFGYGAFIVVVLLSLSGIATLRRIRKEAIGIALAVYSLLLISSSVGLSLYKKSMLLNGQNLPSGGIIGDTLAKLLSAYFNIGGVLLIAAFALLLSLSLSFKMTVRELFSTIAQVSSKFAIYTFAVVAILASRLWEQTKVVSNLFIRSTQFIFGSVMDSSRWFYTFMRSRDPKEVRAKLTAPEEMSEAELITIAERVASDPEEKAATDSFAATMRRLRNSSPIRRDLIDRLLFCLHQMGRSRGELIYADNLSASNHDGFPFASTDSRAAELAKSATREDSDIQIVARQQGSSDHSSSALQPEHRPSSASGNKKAKPSNLFKRIIGKKSFTCPDPDLLEDAPPSGSTYNRSELIENSQTLEEKIADFRIKGKVAAVKPGPVITMYEFKPGTGVKVNSIANLADDLALALAAQSVRIEAPIPGRDVVGIEVPNEEREDVYLKEVVDTKKFRDTRLSIPIAIGKDTFGEPVVADLRKMPHMLVAGATGSGKSVFINCLICSLLFRFNPNELKLILVDPKQLELNFYDSIPHLLVPVVTDAKQASQALRWAVQEMEERYSRIARSGMRDVDGFNTRLAELGAEKMAARLEEDPDLIEPMHKIVIVIDELADLMMTAKSDVENYICRLAQKARAAGIHLVLATQRPSVDVITGLIKANLPARISFRLSSKNDSRTIFDCQGAERLVGNGDMLFMPPGESRLLRMHGAYISEAEIESIAEHWRDQGEPEYREEILEAEEDELGIGGVGADEDSLLQDAIDLALSTGYVSASMVQRRLRVGYNRAARMVEQMEARGIVGPAEGSKPRPVLSQL